MPKAYLIARVNVQDMDKYSLYLQGTREALASFGGKALVRGGAYIALEGEARERNVIIEFPSLQAASDYYNSEGYQSAKALRKGASIGEMIAVEGVE